MPISSCAWRTAEGGLQVRAAMARMDATGGFDE